MTVPVVRKRAKRPKTRTGCRTCRARHIKCDEARPQCNRCVASNRICAGYDAVREPATRSQCALLPRGAGGAEPPVLYPLAKPANISIQMTSHEAHAYDFFRFHTVNQLPGSSWTLSWERLALQVGHHEPAVTHAAVALGSIHRAILAQSQPGSLGIDPDEHHFALSQYNKALGCVRRYIETLGESASNQNVEVVLLVSLLFFCFEVLHNEDARAVLHLRTGLRILYERVRHLDDYRSSAKMIDVEGEEKRVVRMQTRPRNNLDVLLQTFIRLDGDLTIVGDEEPYLFPVCHESIPSVFYSLEEAMVHLDTIASAGHSTCRNIVIMADKIIAAERPELDEMDEDMRNCLACAYSRKIPIDEEQTARLEMIKADMSAWMSALAFLPITSEQESAQLLTQIHFFYTWFIVLSWRDETEILVDRFHAQFDHILTLIERYVTLHGSFLSPDGTDSRSSSPNLTRQAFTVGTDLVPCINMIAFKSRDSKVRRRCIQLLRTINLAGVFDGHYLAAFAEAVADVEEQRARAINGIPPGVDLLCHQVPEEARLVEIELSPVHFEGNTSFYKKDSGRLIYVFFKDQNTRELDIGEKVFTVQRPISATKVPSARIGPSENDAKCCGLYMDNGSRPSNAMMFPLPRKMSQDEDNKLDAPRGWHVRSTGRVYPGDNLYGQSSGQSTPAPLDVPPRRKLAPGPPSMRACRIAHDLACKPQYQQSSRPEDHDMPPVTQASTEISKEPSPQQISSVQSRPS